MILLSKNIKNDIENYYDFWFGINALYERWAKKRGLTFNALFTMYIIYEYSNECTQQIICNRLLLPKQTISAILESFEKKEYITRQLLEKDRRNKRISLTERGKKYADELLSDLFKFEKQAFKNMTLEQRKSLIQNSHIFLKELKNIAEK